jgi:hypothetical protein
MSARSRISLVLLVALGGTMSSRLARGNGRLPGTSSIVIDHDHNVILVGATYGALLSSDQGATWRLVCEQPLLTAGQAIDPVFRFTRTGLLLLASQNGILYSRDNGCTYTGAGGSAANQSFTDLAVSPSDPMRVLATSNTSGAANGVHVSQDGGQTFAAPQDTITQGIFHDVKFAPSDGQRVYAAAYDANGNITIRRSNDGGTHFALTFTLSGFGPPALVGSDPRDENKVYFFARANGVSQLYRSTDGAASFAPVSSDIGTIYAGAFADDGTLVLATDSGIRRSSDGTTIPPAAAGALVVSCLAVGAGGVIYGCASEMNDGFSIGRSTDNGASFTGLMRLGSQGNVAGPVFCPAGSEVCTDCYPAWPDFAQRFMLPNAQAPACMLAPDGGAGTGGGSGTGGQSGAGGSKAGGDSGCSFAAERASPALGALALAVALLCARARASRRRK